VSRSPVCNAVDDRPVHALLFLVEAEHEASHYYDAAIMNLMYAIND
jgi:hypothetical protein